MKSPETYRHGGGWQFGSFQSIFPRMVSYMGTVSPWPKDCFPPPVLPCCACPPSVSNCREPLENDWCCFLGPAHLHPICSCTLSPPRWPEDMFHNGWLVSVTLLAGVKVSYLCTQWSDRSLGLGSENKSDFLPQIGLVYMVCIYVALIAHNKDRKVNSLKTS